MKKKMRVFKGVALTALLALSLVATTGQTLFAARSTGGNDTNLVARGKTQGITWEGITWE